MSPYKPISASEFRVVHLLPGQFGDEIQCVLETRAFEVKTRYEALSYQWGDGSLAKSTLRVARFDPPARKLTSKGDEPPNGRFAWILQKPLGVFGLIAQQHATALRVTLWAGLALFFCQIAPPFFLESPTWILGIIPRHWLMAFLCLSYGHISGIACEKTARLVAEAAKTKPWLLVYNLPLLSGRTQNSIGEGTLTWETILVTPNLELALRYLRLEKRRRILWIDALCINQEDDAEKGVQVRRMDFVYANATAVLIWLGDYHGIGDYAPCQDSLGSGAGPCQHENDISGAFDYMQVVGGFRVAIPGFLRRRSLEQHMEEVMPGLLALSTRGYWQRLWVLQEAALATGSIKLQCGRHVCNFIGFQEAQARALKGAKATTDLHERFQWSRRFALTFQEFRYSPFYDNGVTHKLTQLSKLGLAYLLRYLSPDSEDELNCSFHDRSYSHRLLHVLRWTLGYFECRDKIDRLYAILGVVGGAQKGRSEIANVIEVMSSEPVQTSIAFIVDEWAKYKYGNTLGSVLLRLIFGGLLGGWGAFFDCTATYWTFNRPKYVLTSHDEVKQALGAVRGAYQYTGVSFRAVATYLARDTQSLAFSRCCNMRNVPGHAVVGSGLAEQG